MNKRSTPLIYNSPLTFSLPPPPLIFADFSDKNRHCGLEGFSCDDGLCVDADLQCDWYYDCYDHSDEHDDCIYTGS